MRFRLLIVSLLLTVALGMPPVLNAQDIIVTRGGQTIEATGVIFGPSRISYNLYSDPAGALLSIDTDQVSRIYFENGEKLDLVSPASTESRHYSDLRNLYDPNHYRPQPGDTYNPALLGIVSFVIPGLGQMLEGEWGTGALYLAGAASLYYFTFSTLKRDYKIIDGEMSQIVKGSLKPTIGTALGVAGIIALNTFSYMDAVRIAKVKNMHFQMQPGIAGLHVSMTF